MRTAPTQPARHGGKRGSRRIGNQPHHAKGSNSPGKNVVADHEGAGQPKSVFHAADSTRIAIHRDYNRNTL